MLWSQMEKVNKKFKNLELGFLSFPRAKALPWRGGGGEGYQRNFWVGMCCWEPIMRSRVASFSGLSLRGKGRGFPWLLSSGNRKEIEPKGIPSCFIPSLLVVLFTLATWNLSDISDFATLYLTKLPKSLPTSFPNLQSSSTSKGAFWHFPDFKRGKNSFSSPIPSMQCCAAVQAIFRKQQTLQLWMEGTGEECGFSCSLKLPYLRTMSQR